MPVNSRLKAAGLRVETDLRNEKINYKIRELSADRKIPVIAVVGRKEAEEGKLALRRLGSRDQTILSLEEAIPQLLAAWGWQAPFIPRAAKPLLKSLPKPLPKPLLTSRRDACLKS